MASALTTLNRTVPGTKLSSCRRFTDACLLSLVLCAVTLSWVSCLHGPIDLRWDASVYYVLGTSLAEGKGYRLLNEPGDIRAIQYPPLLPLFIAAHERVLKTTDYIVVAQSLRRSHFVLSLLFAGLTYVLARSYLRPLLAVLTTFLAIFFCYLVYVEQALYADLPYGVAALGFALCATRETTRLRTLASGMIGAVAYLLRTAGIALLIAWVAESLIRRRYRQAIWRTGLALLPILLWNGYIAVVQRSPEYRNPSYPYQRAAYAYTNVSYAENSALVDPWTPELGRITPKQMSRRVATNLLALVTSVGGAVSIPADLWQKIAQRILVHLHSNRTVAPDLIAIVPGVLGVLVIGGLLLLWRERKYLVPLYVAASLLVFSATPWPDQFPRYLASLSPFLALSFIFVIGALGTWCEQLHSARLRKSAFACLVVFLAMIFVVQESVLIGMLTDWRRPANYYDSQGKEITNLLVFYIPVWNPVNTALEWLRTNGDAHRVIACTAPASAYIRTGMKAVLPPMEVDTDRAQRLLDSVPVKYVILDKFGVPGISERYAAPTIEQHPGSWKLIYSSPDLSAQIYERTPADSR